MWWPWADSLTCVSFLLQHSTLPQIQQFRRYLLSYSLLEIPAWLNWVPYPHLLQSRCEPVYVLIRRLNWETLTPNISRLFAEFASLNTWLSTSTSYWILTKDSLQVLEVISSSLPCGPPLESSWLFASLRPQHSPFHSSLLRWVLHNVTKSQEWHPISFTITYWSEASHSSQPTLKGRVTPGGWILEGLLRILPITVESSFQLQLGQKTYIKSVLKEIE